MIMENLLISDLAKAALKELLGYGVLGIVCIILGIAVYKLNKRVTEANKKIIAILERKGKRKDKQLELEERILEQNQELAKSLMESANAQGDLVTKLVNLSKKREDNGKE